MPMRGLKEILDRFYREYDFSGRMAHDPIRFPRRYRDPRDIETAAFLASSFAYGRVELFSAVLEKILGIMGKGPHAFMLGFDVRKHRRLFAGIKYRFNEEDDVLCLLYLLHALLRDYTTIGKAFTSFYREEDRDIGSGLAALMNAFRRIDTSPVYGRDVKPYGLRQFFPSPEDGSACKRANLFLRWMIRDRDIDFGIWKGIPKNKLVIPLDTHIARISRCLGLAKRKSQDWKTAVEITQSLKKFDPGDPLKYDFALCHHGISGMCRGKKEAKTCDGCVLRPR
jgi:uncharacterized protein (TIGR02757 family)